MDGITQFLSAEAKKETVAQLRAYTEVEIKVSENKRPLTAVLFVW